MFTWRIWARTRRTSERLAGSGARQPKEGGKALEPGTSGAPRLEVDGEEEPPLGAADGRRLRHHHRLRKKGRKTHTHPPGRFTDRQPRATSPPTPRKESGRADTQVQGVSISVCPCVRAGGRPRGCPRARRVLELLVELLRRERAPVPGAEEHLDEVLEGAGGLLHLRGEVERRGGDGLGEGRAEGVGIGRDSGIQCREVFSGGSSRARGSRCRGPQGCSARRSGGSRPWRWPGRACLWGGREEKRHGRPGRVGTGVKENTTAAMNGERRDPGKETK